MKRSMINREIADAETLIERHGFKLPPFAFWSREDWLRKGHEADEIRDNALGWDVTDFGSGHFKACGLLLFTVRNGNYQDRAHYPKGYAEKIMVVKERQLTPMHFHWKKREDIINRGGGELIVQVYKSTPNETLSDESLSITTDGIRRDCRAGEEFVLTPGESITLEPGVYHKFYGAPGRGTVIVGEVSEVNDDVADNRFLRATGRYPEIEEDEPAVRLLCTEYPPARGD